MSRIKVTCEIDNYDKPAKPSIRVHSHWNDKNKVEIEVNGERVTIVGKDMIMAIQNCMNVYRV